MAGLVGQQLDQYRLLEQVGQGGMATVYRAQDTRRRREVAVKVLSPAMGTDKRFVRRFRREAGLVLRLQHPGIVSVLDYGECRGLAYLVMPFVTGETLNERLVKRHLTEEEAARWIGQVSAALEFAHRKGVIHRDVKPSNILISRAGDALLTDFGLARLAEGSNSLTGSMMMGTPAYMSPEQGRGLPLDARSDQYSLGVMLYQIATGRLPFNADTPMNTVLMHVQDPVPSPRRFNPELSPLVERVILRSLAKDPAQRYPSVAALNEAYQAARLGAAVPASGMPTLAVPRPPSGSSQPARRSAFGIVAALAAGGLVLVGVLAVPALARLAQAAQPLPAPTFTLQAPPARTSLLPAATATATAIPTPVLSAGCPGLRLLGPTRQGLSVSWQVDNNTGSPLKLAGINLPRLPEHNSVTAIWLGGEPLLQLPPGGTPAAEAAFQIADSERTLIQPGSVSTLSIDFDWADPNPGYSLELSFAGGCGLAASW